MTVSFICADIIDIPAEGLVCSGNINLNMSGGVNGELLSRGGYDLQRQLHGHLEVNDITFVNPGFVMEIGPGNFGFRCIVYSVAIDCWYESSIELVASTLRSALDIIESKGCASVSIPALATGYGRLKKEAFGRALHQVLHEKMRSFSQINVVEQSKTGLAEIRAGYEEAESVRRCEQIETGEAMHEIIDPKEVTIDLLKRVELQIHRE